MKFSSNSRLFKTVALSVFLGICVAGNAQTNSAQQLVQQVVNTELAASQNDHTKWMYRDADKTPEKDTVKLVVQTADGTVSKTILLYNRPPTAKEQAQDHAKMEQIVNDPSARARQRKNDAHDDKQAASLLKMLPDAFIWKQTGEANGEITFSFKPNPAFQPPTYASRVFAAMAGDMVVDASQKRLKVLSGTLIQSVEFGWGILGKLEKGGTFRVVRSEIAPHEWDITQTHVHIIGHALFFKSITEEEDEVTSDYKHSPAGVTLGKAAQMLTDGTVAKDLDIPRK